MKRIEDHYTRPEGHCIVVSDGPIAMADRGGSRDYYTEVKIESDVDTWSSGLDMGITRRCPSRYSTGPGFQCCGVCSSIHYLFATESKTRHCIA